MIVKEHKFSPRTNLYIVELVNGSIRSCSGEILDRIENESNKFKKNYSEIYETAKSVYDSKCFLNSIKVIDDYEKLFETVKMPYFFIGKRNFLSLKKEKKVEEFTFNNKCKCNGFCPYLIKYK
jgi:uncharacterized protein (UPF0335 family)